MNSAACDTRSGCITCGDEGIPVRVVTAGDGYAVCVDDAGERHEVATDLIDVVEPGARLLVHAGVAIAALGGFEPALAPEGRPRAGSGAR